MRAVRHIFFSGLAGISSLLFLAAAILWVRSYFGADYLSRESEIGTAVLGTVGVDGISERIFQTSRGGIQFYDHQLYFDSAGGSIFLGPNDGRFKWSFDAKEQNYPWINPASADPLDRQTVIQFVGFQFVSRQLAVGQSHFWAITLPLGLLTTAFAILPAWWVWRRVASRKRKLQSSLYCSTCGYDLRATVDRCPECGQMINKPSCHGDREKIVGACEKLLATDRHK